MQETEGVQAGKRGIATGPVPIPPERYADLKFNAMKGLPPLLFLPPSVLLRLPCSNVFRRAFGCVQLAKLYSSTL